MKRPSVLRVGPVDFRIVWDEEIAGKYGETDVEKCIIRVASETSQPQRRPTLFHEILHATLGVYGSHLPAAERAARASTEADKNLDTEELYVRALEVGLMQVMRDNPLVFTWLRLP